MKRLLTCLAVIISEAALAQSITMSQADCEATWALMAEKVETVGTARPRSSVGGFCTVTDMAVREDSTIASFDRFEWRGTDLISAFESNLPPTSLDIRLSGLNLEGLFAAMLYEYLPLDMDFSAHWHKAKQEVVLRQLRVILPEDRRLAMSLDVSGVDLSSQTAIVDSVGSGRVQMVSFDVQSNDLIRLVLRSLLGSKGMTVLNEVPLSVLGSEDRRAIERGLAGGLDEISVLIETEAGISFLQAMSVASPNASISTLVEMFPDVRISVQ